MKNHGKPLDLRALYFETKPNFHLQILQLCFFNFCRWIHSTWFCSQFPSHWTTFFRRFIIKISFECLGRHTSTMHDICSPKTGAWSVWYQMMSIPLSIPFNSCFFTDSSTYKDYNVFCFFRIFCRKMDEDKTQETSRFHGSETMADHPTDHKWLISLVIVSLWFVAYLTNGVEKTWKNQLYTSYDLWMMILQVYLQVFPLYHMISPFEIQWLLQILMFVRYIPVISPLVISPWYPHKSTKITKNHYESPLVLTIP